MTRNNREPFRRHSIGHIVGCDTECLPQPVAHGARHCVHGSLLAFKDGSRCSDGFVNSTELIVARAVTFRWAEVPFIPVAVSPSHRPGRGVHGAPESRLIPVLPVQAVDRVVKLSPLEGCLCCDGLAVVGPHRHGGRDNIGSLVDALLDRAGQSLRLGCGSAALKVVWRPARRLHTRLVPVRAGRGLSLGHVGAAVVIHVSALASVALARLRLKNRGHTSSVWARRAATPAARRPAGPLLGL
eukprot:scaffold222259_cov33-Tisochrysis_lutea.AAC.1